MGWDDDDQIFSTIFPEAKVIKNMKACQKRSQENFFLTTQVDRNAHLHLHAWTTKVSQSTSDRRKLNQMK